MRNEGGPAKQGDSAAGGGCWGSLAKASLLWALPAVSAKQPFIPPLRHPIPLGQGDLGNKSDLLLVSGAS